MRYDAEKRGFVDSMGKVVGYVMRNRKRRSKAEVSAGIPRQPWQVCGPLCGSPAARGRGISFGYLPVGAPHDTIEAAIEWGLAHFEREEMDVYERNTNDVLAFLECCRHIPLGPVNGCHDLRNSFDHAVDVMVEHADDLPFNSRWHLSVVRKIEDLDGTVDWGAVYDGFMGGVTNGGDS